MEYAKLVARNPKDGTVTLYAEYRHKDRFKRVPTGVKTTVARWNNEKQVIRLTGTAFQRKEGKDANDTIQQVLKNLNNQIESLYLSNGNILPTIDQLNTTIEAKAETIEADNIPVEAEAALVSELIAFVAQQTDWAPATVKGFVTLGNNIKAFEKAQAVTWYLSSLTNQDIIDWQHWLLKTYDYNNATLGKRVRLLRQFLAEKQPVTVNLSKIKPLHSQLLMPPVVLSQKEIEAIRALDLHFSPRLDRVRDLMIAQIFSGLRFSDLIRLEKHHIQKGHIVIRMQKTNQTVRIPLFPPVAAVVAKYTDTKTGELALPELSNQKFNGYIKELCQFIPELRKEVSIEFKKRDKTDSKKVAKWELISSHSSRRSFCSLCLDLGFSVKEVMQWSGHRTMQAFSRYIGLTDVKEDAADDFTARYAAKMAG